MDQEKISGFIEGLFTVFQETPVDPATVRRIQSGQLAEVIYERITSKRFRKTAVEPATADFTRKYLREAVAGGQKIRIYFLFGGYKQSRMSTAPDPDWAEVFDVSFSLEVANAVESIYKTGVDIIYRSDEMILTYLDNYSQRSREIYTGKFKQILEIFNSRIPSGRNIKLSYESAAETSPLSEVIKIVDEVYPRHEAIFNAQPREVQEEMTFMAYRNICWNGEEDLTGMPETEKLAKARKAYITRDAWIEADVKLAAAYFNNGVSISFRKGIPMCIHYGSCASSTVQFSAGEGFINIRDDKLLPWILSYNQMQEVKSEEFILTAGNPFAGVGLTKIRVINGRV